MPLVAGVPERVAVACDEVPSVIPGGNNPELTDQTKGPGAVVAALKVCEYAEFLGPSGRALGLMAMEAAGGVEVALTETDRGFGVQ